MEFHAGHVPRWCHQCGERLQDEFLPCPAACGRLGLCSLDCVREHRQKDCPLAAKLLPTFAEGFCGPNAPLSWQVAVAGGQCVRPLDRLRPPYPDVLCASGQTHVEQEFNKEEVAIEFWAPDCSSMTRARGRPILLPDGRRILGPPALRSNREPEGFTWGLRTADAKKVRDGNAMADLALARLSWRIHNWGIGLYEQPWDSFAWQLPRAVAMHRTGRFWATRLCNGCHGGRRVKWTCVWHNCERFHAAFHQDFSHTRMKQDTVWPSTPTLGTLCSTPHRRLSTRSRCAKKWQRCLFPCSRIFRRPLCQCSLPSSRHGWPRSCGKVLGA